MRRCLPADTGPEPNSRTSLVLPTPASPSSTTSAPHFSSAPRRIASSWSRPISEGDSRRCQGARSRESSDRLIGRGRPSSCLAEVVRPVCVAHRYLGTGGSAWLSGRSGRSAPATPARAVGAMGSDRNYTVASAILASDSCRYRPIDRAGSPTSRASVTLPGVALESTGPLRTVPRACPGVANRASRSVVAVVFRIVHGSSSQPPL